MEESSASNSSDIFPITSSIKSSNVTIPENATKNIIYNALGVQASFKIESRGDYVLEGQGNMVYSGYGYSPNYQNLTGSGNTYNNGKKTAVIEDTDGGTLATNQGISGTGMIPYIDLTKYVHSYGDDNIILYFYFADSFLQNNTFATNIAVTPATNFPTIIGKII